MAIENLLIAAKLLRGIVRACEKTRVSYPKVDAIVDNIEVKLQQNSKENLAVMKLANWFYIIYAKKMK